jgi:hypothetical protein
MPASIPCRIADVPCAPYQVIRMKQINFDAPAILEKATVADLGDGCYGMTDVRQIFSGTLTECLQQFMQKRESQKPRYNILTGEDARVGKCHLAPEDIELLTKQPNYPLRDN